MEIIKETIAEAPVIMENVLFVNIRKENIGKGRVGNVLRSLNIIAHQYNYDLYNTIDYKAAKRHLINSVIKN